MSGCLIDNKMRGYIPVYSCSDCRRCNKCRLQMLSHSQHIALETRISMIKANGIQELHRLDPIRLKAVHETGKAKTVVVILRYLWHGRSPRNFIQVLPCLATGDYFGMRTAFFKFHPFSLVQSSPEFVTALGAAIYSNPWACFICSPLHNLLSVKLHLDPSDQYLPSVSPRFLSSIRYLYSCFTIDVSCCHARSLRFPICTALRSASISTDWARLVAHAFLESFAQFTNRCQGGC